MTTFFTLLGAFASFAVVFLLATIIRLFTAPNDERDIAIDESRAQQGLTVWHPHAAGGQ